jgi:hypothetical protein
MDSIGLVFKIAADQITHLSRECKTLSQLKNIINYRYKTTVTNELFELLDLNQLMFFFHCSDGNVEEVKRMLEDQNFDVSFDYNKSIIAASSRGHEEIVSLLLERIKSFDDVINFLLKKEIQYGHFDNTVKILSFSNCDPSQDKDFILITSISSNINIFKMLLKHPKIIIESNNNYVFKHTTHIDALKILLEIPRIDPNSDKNYAIKNLCCSEQNIESFKVLLYHPRVEVNFIDERNGSLLAIAIKNGNERAFNEIIRCPRFVLVLDQKIINSIFEMDCTRDSSKLTEMMLREPKLDLLIKSYNLFEILFKCYSSSENPQRGKAKILEVLLRDYRLNTSLKSFNSFKDYKYTYPQLVKRMIQEERVAKILSKKELELLVKELKNVVTYIASSPRSKLMVTI